MAPELIFTKEGFVINTDKTPEVKTKKSGTTYRLTDCNITHLNEIPPAKELKEYQADVIILQHAHVKAMQKLKPKLAILIKNTVYTARDLHQKTGVQVITAQPGTTIDLKDYNALAKQKTLKKFTKEE